MVKNKRKILSGGIYMIFKHCLISFFVATSVIAIFVVPAYSQEKLSPEEKKETLEWVKQAKESCLSNNSKRIKKAQTIIFTACSSKQAAMNLYIEATKSNILNPSFGGGDMYKHYKSGIYSMLRADPSLKKKMDQSPSSLFSEWKKENTGSKAKPGMEKALQLQLKWLLLRLGKAEADIQKKEFDAFPASMGILDEYMANVKDTALGMEEASSGVATVVKYLNIEDIKPKGMPRSVEDVSSIYSQVLLPSCKKSKDVAALRSMWGKRIALEIAVKKALVADSKNPKKDEEKIAGFFLKLQSLRERHCYEMGEEEKSLNNMKKIILMMRDPSDQKEAVDSMEDMIAGKKVPEEQAKRKYPWVNEEDDG